MAKNKVAPFFSGHGVFGTCCRCCYAYRTIIHILQALLEAYSFD